MRKICCISLVLGVLLLAFMPSCGKKGTTSGGATTFVERIKPLDESLLMFLDSYTSGVIANGEPIVVRFNNPEALKVKYGEDLSSKSFSFSPSLKGKAVWIDENTVGFQYDNIDKNQNYVCKFKMSDFVDVPADQTLEFGFGVRRQNFSLVTAQPICTSNESMNYLLRVAFAVPVDQDEVVNLFDDVFRKSHPVQVTATGNNVYDFEVQNFERKNNAYEVPVVLDGKALDCKAKMERNLAIYAKDSFEPVMFDVDKAAGKGTLLFTQPLRQGHAALHTAAKREPKPRWLRELQQKAGL